MTGPAFDRRQFLAAGAPAAAAPRRRLGAGRRARTQGADLHPQAAALRPEVDRRPVGGDADQPPRQQLCRRRPPRLRPSRASSPPSTSPPRPVFTDQRAEARGTDRLELDDPARALFRRPRAPTRPGARRWPRRSSATSATMTAGRRIHGDRQGARRRLGLGAPDLEPARRLANDQWAADTMTLAGGVHLLALGTCASTPTPWTTAPAPRRLSTAFMKTIRWTEADARFAKLG